MEKNSSSRQNPTTDTLFNDAASEGELTLVGEDEEGYSLPLSRTQSATSTIRYSNEKQNYNSSGFSRAKSSSGSPYQVRSEVADDDGRNSRWNLPSWAQSVANWSMWPNKEDDRVVKQLSSIFATSDVSVKERQLCSLLESGLSPNYRNAYNQSLLYQAAKEGDAELARLLVTHGADIDAISGPESAASPPLQHNFNRNKHFRRGTALQVACIYRQPEVVEALLKAGADVKKISNTSWLANALMVAICAQSAPFVRKLLYAGADPNFACDGYTPLQLAAFFGYADIVACLVKRGADMEALGKNQETALVTAMRHPEAAFASITLSKFISLGVDVNGAKSITTPIQVATMRQHWEVVKQLLAAGAHPNGHDVGSKLMG